MNRWYWEPWELALVDAGESPALISKMTGRTIGSVYAMRNRRGADSYAAPAWEPWEIEMLRDGTPASEAARATGRTVDAVRTKKSELKRRGVL